MLANDGPLEWVTGLFYREAEQIVFEDLDVSADSINTDDVMESTQYSIFGNTTLSLFDGVVDIGVGVSYFEDETKNTTDLSPDVTTPVVNKTDSNIVSPQASISYHPTKDSSIYFRYAEGFRPGTVNFGISTYFGQLDNPAITGIVDTEEITAFELGIKGDWFSGRLYSEIALFYNKIDDLQQFSFIFRPGSDTPNFTILNTGEGRSTGIEWLFIASPIDGLDLTLSGTYTEEELVDDFFAPGSDPATTVPLYGKGDRISGVPELILGTSVSYSRSLGDSGFIARTAVNVQYSSAWSQAVLSADPFLSDDILRTDLRLEVGRGNWSVYLFVKNLTNEDGEITPIFRRNLFASDAPFTGNPGLRLRPRTIGAGIRVNF